jgi:hypothetical protein
MSLRIEGQDIIADRDEAKRQWEWHANEVARWRDIYLAYEALARLTSAGADTTLTPETNGNNNGHRPAETVQPTVKEVLLKVISESEGLTAQEIRAQVSAVRNDVKDKYIYNLLTDLTKKEILEREEGRYYEKKKD